MTKAVELAPDSWIPGGVPDPLIAHKHGLIGAPVSRLDGPLKVQGRRRSPPSSRSTAWSTPPWLQHRRRRAASRARHQRGRGAPGVVLVMTHRTRRG